MSIPSNPTILEQSREHFRQRVEKENLLATQVLVLAKPLTPEEAIGTPGRRDFPIIIGKERIIEARVLESLGHAFTDSAQEFEGTVEDVLQLDLTTNQNRAVFVATLNATLRHLGQATATVHCKDEDPEQCAQEIAEQLFQRHGKCTVGFIGLNPAIAERLVSTFGAEHVRITDLNKDNFGKRKFGVEIWDGAERTEDLINESDVILVTGTTLVNGTFDNIREKAIASGKRCPLYGVTAAGLNVLLGLERICPRGQ